MEDLFTEKQQILDEDFLYLKDVKNGAAFDPHRYAVLLGEYHWLHAMVAPGVHTEGVF